MADVNESFFHSTALIVFAFLSACSPDARIEPDRISQLTSAEEHLRLESSIPSLMESGQVTGLSIAITTDSGIVWAAGFGKRSEESGEPVDTLTVFEAASLSKPVFAYAFLQLVDDGMFDLDTPISEYYQYEAIAHEEWRSEITPRMVLTHSPGFPNWRPRGGQLTINFEPGGEFSYSGEGFVYLQRAVMFVTGEPLNQIAARLVFEPLEMRSSSYLWQEEFDATVALPHGSDGEVRRKFKPQSGHGNAAASLHTTAPDFARFIMAVMNGTGLSDSTAAAMLSPQIDVDSNVTWGLGIGLQDNEYGRGFWHWGDNTGYKAYTLSYPERGAGVVWFTNSEHGHAILDGMLGLVFGGDHPASRWLGYEQYDSPGRAVREELERVCAQEGIDSAIARYHDLKTSTPAEAFDEGLLNSLGYRLMRNDMLSHAITVFELNVAEYPDASDPYDSLGEAYLAAGDTARAIVNYERSVELDPNNTNGAAVLERLRGGTN
jgi:CubicO group peptidase (beta-lactamase class C family)